MIVKVCEAPVQVTDPRTSITFQAKIDLLKLKYKEITELPNQYGYFTVEIPMRKKTVTFKLLTTGEDNQIFKKAQAIKEEYCTAVIAVYRLPDEAWARRISGVFSNELANKMPGRAHAIISYNAHGGYQISVRAPLVNKTGADELCSLFSTGGGRKSAAGINHLPFDELALFIAEFEKKYT